VPQTNVAVKQEAARNIMLKEGATVEELVRALTAIGSTPRDIISILQNLKSAGRWMRTCADLGYSRRGVETRRNTKGKETLLDFPSPAFSRRLGGDLAFKEQSI